jgi:hypothetical protein
MTQSYKRAEDLYKALEEKKGKIDKRQAERFASYVKDPSPTTQYERELQDAAASDKNALSETAQVTAAALWDIVKHRVDRSKKVENMLDADIKYPVEGVFPPDEQTSIGDMQE